MKVSELPTEKKTVKMVSYEKNHLPIIGAITLTAVILCLMTAIFYLDRVNRKFDSVDSSISMMKIKLGDSSSKYDVEALERRVEKLPTKDSVNGRFDSIEEKLEKLATKEDVHKLISLLEDMKKQKQVVKPLTITKIKK